MRVEEYRCDYCGEKCAPEFEVTRGDLFDDERMEMHFCSWECLARYSGEAMKWRKQGYKPQFNWIPLEW